MANTNTVFLRNLRKKKGSIRRIYSVLRKGTWKESSEIREAAGEQVTDAMRRLRELRSMLKTVGRDIETERVPGSYQYRYRIIG